MRYDQYERSVNAMICNGSYLDHWKYGVPMYESRENIQQHTKDLESRIEQEMNENIEEGRQIYLSLTAAKELQR